MPALHDPQHLEVQHLRQISALNGATVLEIGAGDGRLTALYAAWAQQIISIDMDSARLQTAQESGTDAHLIQTDAIHLPFADAYFDVVLFAWSL